MTAIFRPEGRLFRATGHARGLWSGYAAGQRNHRADDARGRTDGKFVLWAPDYHRCVRWRDLRALPVPELTSAAAIKLNKQA